jgi:hypothetical protein
VRILKDVVVPEAKNVPAEIVQISCPVTIDVFAVLAAIRLDDEAALDAREVGDVVSDRFLPAELEAAKLTISQPGPKPMLGIRRLASKPPRVRIRSSDHCHGCFLDEGKPSPNPLPRAGEG